MQIDMEPMEFGSDIDSSSNMSVDSPMQQSGWDVLSEEKKKLHNNSGADFMSVESSHLKDPSPRSRWNTYHNIVSAVNAFTGFKLNTENSVVNGSCDSPQNFQSLYRSRSLELSPSSPNSLYPDLSTLVENKQSIHLPEQDNKLYSSVAKDRFPTKRRKFDSNAPVTRVTDSPIRKLCESSKKQKRKRLNGPDLDDCNPSVSKTAGVGKSRCCRILFIIITVCMLIVLIYYTESNSSCSSYTDVNFSQLSAVISADLYGQHIASHVISTEMEKYFSEYSSSLTAIRPLVLSLHGWTGVGKNYITWLIYHFLAHTTVTKFLIPLHFGHESKSNIYSKQIFEWLISNVTKCKVNIFIVDEMDKAPEGVTKGLSSAISHLSVLDTKSAPVVIFLLSNSKGTEITRKILFEENATKQRESFMLQDFKDIFWQDESFWYSDMLSNNLISAVVPFLPLERRHVIRCIRRDMLSKGYEVKDHLVDQVLREMSFFTVPSGRQYSQTGCKRVSDKVNLVHEYS